MAKQRRTATVEDIAETPIRGDLFSVERLEEFAVYLSDHLKVVRGSKIRRPLLKRLKDSDQKLLHCYTELSVALREKETITPAAEWFVDNFHIIEDQVREIKNDLPKSYYNELPKLGVGDLVGYPRIYALALSLIAHTDSRLDAETIRRFVKSFQVKSSLTIGELWAVPITLRLALVENVRRVALRVAWDRSQRLQGDAIADEVFELAGKGKGALQKTLDKISGLFGPSADKDYALISQLVKRFRDQEPEVWPAMERVEKCLAQQNLNIEAIVNIEHQIQAANLVTIANIITSMRLLSNLNWQTFFESVSVLDRILEKDPVGAYAQMDFKTRDEYRHFIERASRKSKLTELEIAEKAVSLAQEAQNKNPQDHRKSHVGYYFRERGIEKLAVHCGYKVPWTTQWRYRISIRPTVFYIASLMLLTAALMVGPIYYALENGAELGLLIIAGLLLFIPCGDLAVSIFNFLLTNIVHPKPLPKMDYSKGVPDEARTLVVVPCLLSDIETIDSLLEKMEVHYLGNSDANIFFGLATDFKDAASEHTPMDQSLLERVQNGVRALNQKYDPLRAERFALFHRHRLWNSADEKWMGWERKRGKLEELNRLLRNGGKGSFAVVTLPEEILPTFKYVITLDADTHLGRDVASKLIATGMHPLNRPVFDEKQGRVVKGYGLIQPRISISLESSARSIFAKVFSGHTGIDPYTTAVSDIYQDLFLEGSFTGKGIYDIDAFEMSLRGKIPENTVLSHDLLEGLFARAALVTDIELLDDYPKTYRTFFLRQHRWTRGDWQIARWMFQANSLPLISRWKIYDNLRRSLVAVGLFLLFVAGWTLMPGSVFFWTALPIFIIAVPAFIHVANGILISPRGVPWSSNFWNVVGNARMNLAQFFLSLAFLVHQAAIQVDAIVRVFYRQMISKKDRLEWVTAADQEKITHRVNSLWQTPWIVETVLFVTLLLVASRGSLLVLATSLPFLLLWACYPWIAHVTSYRRKKEYDLQVQDKEFLELIARRIWHFFETFVTKEDNFLPPDNYQEDPEGVVAHRTSPTNIGLYTLAVVTAKDLGYLGTRVCLDRLNDTFLTLKRLETYKGHFYNWYDTQSLEPLYPKYISMVDSGNFAGYLLAVKQTCIELEDAPILGPRTLHALRLTLSIVESEADSISTRRQTSAAVSVAYVLKDVQEIQKNLFTSEPRKFTEWDLVARMLKNAIDDVHDSILTLEQENGERPYRHLKSWVEALLVQINDLQKDLELFAPWLSWVGEFSHEVVTELDHAFIPSAMLVSYNAALVKIASMQHDSKDLDSGKNLPPRSALVELDHLEESLKRGRGHVLATLKQCQDIAAFCEMLFVNMDFEFLFDKDREVFSIGYNVIEGRHDNSFYDLLASEARLGSFIAIAKGDVDQKHWFRLGRQLVSVEGRRALISWSASMFEYLMPSLVMKDYDNTLLHETMHAVVERQISYGKKQKVPWGVSEAGYNARDLNFNYQYGPFGIPGLGLKRGLSHDLVISPYSTFLALEQNPKKSLRNLSELIKLRTLTRYGFYESLDFTPERVEEKQKFAVIRSFMAHHQGMSLVAINNLLNTSIMQKRFHSELRVKATQLLLQERVPQKVPLATPKAALIEWEFAGGESLQKSFTRQYDTAHMRSPRVQILSNGKYSLMLTTAGSGYAKWEGIAVTRWREDVTRDCWGSFVYVKDLTTNRVWSSCHQPMGVEPDKYAVTLSEEKVEYRRQDSDVRTKTEVIVAPEDNVELRQITIYNHSPQAKVFELTSYAEPVLAPMQDDAAHPSFSNLFLQTEYLANRNALIAKRRPRLSKKSEMWGLHVVTTEGDIYEEPQYETDRARFIGRGRTLKNPLAMIEGSTLSQTVGSTLDPIFSLRVRLKVPAGSSGRVIFTTGIARTREEILQLADRYHDIHAFERESKIAWTKARIDLRHLGLDSESAYIYQRLAERILYSDSMLRPPMHILTSNIRTQSSLWPYGISGDIPIVAVNISDRKELLMVRRLIRGHEYLRLKGLVFDLVLLNESRSTYLQELNEELLQLVRSSGSQAWLGKSGGIFVLKTDIMAQADRQLIQAMARVVFSSDRGSLRDQLGRKLPPENYPPAFVASQEPVIHSSVKMTLPVLEFFNGLGGFTRDGKEYVIALKAGQWTPAPWINVIANAHDFGFQVSETGSGFTWAVNSRENRITGWSNDPVMDTPSEVIYLRDEETGEFWTPTPLPIRSESSYIIRHGQGYTSFEHASHGMQQVLTQFVSMTESVKISRLRLKNVSGKPRNISITNYVEWVLGNQREKAASYTIVERDSETKALMARNPHNQEFANRISFMDLNEGKNIFTCDRKEFLGRNGSYDNPAALRRQGLAQRTGIGQDPAGVLQAALHFDRNQEREVIILLGQADDVQKARELVKKYRSMDVIEKTFAEVEGTWDRILNRIQVTTPEKSLNLMLNKWLLYQAMVCRMWARSAFYQSGGAYGFRDQLQDCMAFVYSAPDIAKEHILRAARRQFVEGDVQHWWHPPTGRGVRTHFSDDRLWLPYVVCHYIRVTGDLGILAEEATFIEAPLLPPEQEDSYNQPTVSQEKASLLEHCLRAIDISLNLGVHGLPLIGAGDWNDGMNRIGHEGKGESVWMGWFLYKVIEDFLPHVEGQQERKERYKQHLKVLKENIEKNAWDGHWYRRAFYDDGTAIGSLASDECKIDSIAQTWSVLSGAGDPERQKIAMQNLESHLIQKDKGIALLLTPPFDKTPHDPGYIKGYVPGVRENGGQYTHAAIWVMMAFAELRDGNRTLEMFNMLNPIHHGQSKAGLHRYKIEPYVVAADIYAVEPHTGRGGWSWYTGSASWFYRAGIESLLGFRLEGEKLHLEPRMPDAWRSFEISYRYKSSLYRITVKKSKDGRASEVIQLVDDGKIHDVTIHVPEGKVTFASEPDRPIFYSGELKW